MEQVYKCAQRVIQGRNKLAIESYAIFQKGRKLVCFLSACFKRRFHSALMFLQVFYIHLVLQVFYIHLGVNASFALANPQKIYYRSCVYICVCMYIYTHIYNTCNMYAYISCIFIYMNVYVY